jgi:hypothetical protein
VISVISDRRYKRSGHGNDRAEIFVFPLIQSGLWQRRSHGYAPTNMPIFNGARLILKEMILSFFREITNYKNNSFWVPQSLLA